jgi:3',5'-cyclic-AMP phosphodiesterase
MPGFFHRPVTRRGFIGGATLAAAGFAVRGSSIRLNAESQGASTPFRVALLADTHIPADPENQYRGFFPTRNLESIVPQILESQPEAAIICGDAARLSGERADYEALKELLAPLAGQTPIHIALGNHDNRQHFHQVFDQASDQRQDVAGKHVVVLDQPGLRFVILDSLLYVDRVAGLLGRAQRQWLARFLETADRRTTLLMVHHTLGDGDGDLLDVDRMFALIRPHPHVKAIFYGHSHVWSVTRHERLHLINLPAVGYNFRDQDPVGWIDAAFTPNGAELTLRALAGDRTQDGRVTSLQWS